MKYDIITLGGFLYAVEKRSNYKIYPREVYIKAYPTNSVVIAEASGWADWNIVVATTDHSLNLPLLPDVEGEADRWEAFDIHPKKANASKDWVIGFHDGYKAASAKKFTEGDMIEFLNYYLLTVPFSINSTGENNGLNNKEVFDKYIKFRTPSPTAVEVEMTTIQTTKQEDYQYYGNHQSNLNYVSVPVVDENGYVKVNQWYYE